MKLTHSLSLLSLALTCITTIAAAEQDPQLTEKSQETFNIEFDGLPLSLPVELRNRVLSQAQDGKLLKKLEIGNVDLAYSRLDPKTSESKLIKGWIEGEAFKDTCTAQKEMDSIRKLLLSEGHQDTIKVQHIVNDKFNGYIVTWAQISHGTFSGINLQLIDSKKASCYTFSLATQDFERFTSKEIKDAVSPLSSAIKKSLFSYANAVAE